MSINYFQAITGNVLQRHRERFHKCNCGSSFAKHCLYLSTQMVIEMYDMFLCNVSNCFIQTLTENIHRECAWPILDLSMKHSRHFTSEVAVCLVMKRQK